MRKHASNNGVGIASGRWSYSFSSRTSQVGKCVWMFVFCFSLDWVDSIFLLVSFWNEWGHPTHSLHPRAGAVLVHINRSTLYSIDSVIHQQLLHKHRIHNNPCDHAYACVRVASVLESSLVLLYETHMVAWMVSLWWSAHDLILILTDIHGKVSNMQSFMRLWSGPCASILLYTSLHKHADGRTDSVGFEAQALFHQHFFFWQKLHAIIGKRVLSPTLLPLELFQMTRRNHPCVSLGWEAESHTRTPILLHFHVRTANPKSFVRPCTMRSRVAETQEGQACIEILSTAHVHRILHFVPKQIRQLGLFGFSFFISPTWFAFLLTEGVLLLARTEQSAESLLPINLPLLSSTIHWIVCFIHQQ